MKRKILSLIVLALIFSPLPGKAGDFKVFVNPLPPLKYLQDGMVTGVAGDIFIQVMQQAGLSFETTDIKECSLSQSMEEVAATPNTLCLALAKTPQREKTFIWVGPIYTSRIAFIGKRSNHITVNTLKDAQKYTVVTVRNSAPHKILTEAAFPHTILTATTEEAIKLLDEGKADLFLFPISPAFYSMTYIGVPSCDYEKLLEVKNVTMYFAFNPKTNKDKIERFSKAFEALKPPDDQGECPYRKIIKSHFQPYM
jgi:polar amino acid transport system substrate-binding protein